MFFPFIRTYNEWLMKFMQFRHLVSWVYRALSLISACNLSLECFYFCCQYMTYYNLLFQSMFFYLIEFTQVRVGFKNGSILKPYVLQVARVCSIRGTEQSGTLGRLLKVSEATVNLSLPVQMPSFFLT